MQSNKLGKIEVYFRLNGFPSFTIFSGIFSFHFFRNGKSSESFRSSSGSISNKECAYLLLESADSINAKLRLPALSRQINEDMVKHAINLSQDALRSCGKTLRRSRVAVLGTIRANNATGIFVKMLELKGAKVNLFDPVSKSESLGTTVAKSSLNEAVEGTDCIIILTRKEQCTNLNLKKLKPLTRAPSAIVDLAGVYEPQKAEAEGFLYRGLGRGTR